MARQESEPARIVLQSWKEIAARLGVTVRSVQRWEKTSGLPVHRHSNTPSARIFAYADEIDNWVASGALRRAQVAADEPAPARRAHAWWFTGGAAFVAATFVFLWGVNRWPHSRLPHSWRADGAKLTILDESGRICWEKQFPAFATTFVPAIHDWVVIQDLDGDGSPEVLFNYLPKSLSRPQGMLMCFSSAGKLLWERPFGAAKQFGGRSFEPYYRGQIVRPLRIAGRPLILTIANHNIWFPSQVALLDADSGRVTEEYWHPGSIYLCELRDLDGDGAEELLFAAINNPGQGLGHAALGILTLPFSRAPRRAIPPDDRFPPLTGGGELAYALLPLPDVSRAAGLLPIAVDLRIDDSRRIFFVAPLPENGGVAWYLDFGLRVLEHRVSDNFTSLHRRMESQGLLDHSVTPEEIAALGIAALFPAAPDGNSPELKKFWRY